MINLLPYKLRFCRGLSLVEVIIAVALFSLFATALIGLVVTNFGSDVQARDKILATRLAEQGLEAVQSIRRQAWNLLANGSYGITATGGSWQFAPGPDDFNGVFTRTITVADGCRDVTGVLVDCSVVGAIHDLYTKKITSNVTYTAITGVANDVTLTTYLTNWQSRDWAQTDWSAGAGQTIWANPVQYDSSAGVDVSVSGSVTLVNQTNNWTEHNQSPLASQSLTSIVVLDPDDAWAAGASGKIFHYDGSSWLEFIDTGNQTWNALSVASSTDGWVVGSSGQVYRFDGLSWSLFVDIGNISLHAVEVVSPDDGWAVGASGKIYHFDGVAWGEFADMGNNAINSIDMLSSTDGWAVGASGKIYHFDGVAWGEFADMGNNAINSIDMLSSTDGWAVGNSGDVYRFNGTTWTSVSVTVNNSLNGIYILGASGWVVGNNGVVLELSGSGYATDGWLVSSAFNTGAVSAFNALSWSQLLSGCTGCSIKLQIRTALDASGIPGIWTNWYGAGGPGTYFTAADPQLLPQALNFNEWIQYRVELAGDGNGTPTLYDVNINYTP